MRGETSTPTATSLSSVIKRGNATFFPFTFSLIGILICLSGLAHFFNLIHTHYFGNNYFPPDAFVAGIILLAVYLGAKIQFGANNKSLFYLKEIIYFFSLMALIAFATNAVQLTPFTPIDQSILVIEKFLHIHLEAMLSWTNHYSLFKKILIVCYESLPYQMALFPLFLIAFKKINLLREYYFLMLLTTIIGFSFYYFFPTIAPAGMLSADYFSHAQRATSIKFMEIHHYIPPSTIEGGLIALPSFHTIWAWLCLFLLKPWPCLFYFILPVNCLLMLSCVLLGWHYVLDIMGGMIVLFIAFSTKTYVSRWH